MFLPFFYFSFDACLDSLNCGGFCVFSFPGFLVCLVNFACKADMVYCMKGNGSKQDFRSIVIRWDVGESLLQPCK